MGGTDDAVGKDGPGQAAPSAEPKEREDPDKGVVVHDVQEQASPEQQRAS
jgi:hypothetical protein